EFVGRPEPFRLAGVILALLPIAAAARGAAERSREAVFWSAWLAGYALLFISWEPYTVVYRVSDLPALWALATLGLRTLPPRRRLGALLSWTLAAFAYNLAFVVRPASDPANNPHLVEAEWIKANAPPEAWILAGGNGAVYIPYFAGRRPVNLRYYADEAALRARLDSLAAAGEAVYVGGLALEDQNLRARLERYGLKPAASRAGLSLFRVARGK
ncbi:MAG: hypothetical protein HY403_10450, partial [Elusimicrobia bacterium]|nr:hypothetical protein [Elusimicrobiota bacterium]